MPVGGYTACKAPFLGLIFIVYSLSWIVHIALPEYTPPRVDTWNAMMSK